jgi:ketosteroid isomerase-like protein
MVNADGVNTMKNTMTLAIAALTAFTLLPAIGQAKSADEAKIEELEAAFAAAFIAKSVDAIMKVYVPDESLIVFDVVPPRQYVGANAYRKDWEDFFAAFKGPLKFEITDLHVVADGTLGYGHSIQHVSGTDAKGQPMDLVVRVTDAYRKVGNDWLIVHEHVSVPVDLTTGKPDLASKP